MGTLGKDNPSFYLEDKTVNVQHQNTKTDHGVVEITTDTSKLEYSDSDLDFEDKEFEGDYVGNLIEKFWTTVRYTLSEHKSIVKSLLLTRYYSITQRFNHQHHILQYISVCSYCIIPT